MKEPDYYYLWSNRAEHKYLDGIGTYHDDCPYNRTQMLFRYLHAAYMRTYWGGIDREEIIARVEGELGI
jgi:hypothetical protein